MHTGSIGAGVGSTGAGVGSTGAGVGGAGQGPHWDPIRPLAWKIVAAAISE